MSIDYSLNDIIKGVAKALEPKFERIDRQNEVLKSMVAAVQSEIRVIKLEQQGLKIAIDGVNNRVDRAQNMLLDAIGEIAPDLTTIKEYTDKLEERVTTLEHL